MSFQYFVLSNLKFFLLVNFKDPYSFICWACSHEISIARQVSFEDIIIMCLNSFTLHKMLPFLDIEWLQPPFTIPKDDILSGLTDGYWTNSSLIITHNGNSLFRSVYIPDLKVPSLISRDNLIISRMKNRTVDGFILFQCFWAWGFSLSCIDDVQRSIFTCSINGVALSSTKSYGCYISFKHSIKRSDNSVRPI